MYEELIKLLKYAAQTEATNHPTWNELMQKAADAIEELTVINERQLLEIAVLSKPRWIPVSERLPEYCRNVIVTDGEYVSMGWLDNYRDRNGTVYITWYAPNSSANENHISHWMPLPEPPTDGEV